MQTQSVIKPRQHFDNLLLVRALACLAVAWSHTYTGQILLFGKDISFVPPNAFTAVFVFYLLSGYTIGLGFTLKKYSLSMSSLGKFYIHRFLRIAPLYYFVLIICIFYLYREFQFTTMQIIYFFTFTSLPAHLYPLSYVLIEMQFYLVAPLLFFFIDRLSKKIPLWVVGVIVFFIGGATRFAIILYSGNGINSYLDAIYSRFYGNLDFFLFGMLLAIMTARKETQHLLSVISENHKYMYYFVFLVWLFWTNYIVNTAGYEAAKYQILFLLPPLTSLIVGAFLLFTGLTQRVHPVSLTVMTPKHLIKNLCSVRSFLFALGTLSYGIYVWHYPWLDYLFYRTNADHTLPAAFQRFLIAFPLTLFSSIATYCLIEYPMTRVRLWLKKFNL